MGVFAPSRRVVLVIAGLLLVAALGAVVVRAALPQQSGTVDLLSQANVTIDGGSSGEHGGTSVANAGDVNGDGLSDVIIGAPQAGPGGGANAGTAYVVFGQPSPGTVDLFNLGSHGFRIDGGVPGETAGMSVAGAGDVNRDGLADVIVGAPNATYGGSNSGAAFVVFGKSSTSAVDLNSLGAQGFRIDGLAGDRAGVHVGGTKDVNGDGIPDVIVGAPDASANGRSESGTAYVVFGKASSSTVDLSSLGAQGFRIDGAGAGDFTSEGTGAGDVNGDGRQDLIVGGLEAHSGTGAAYVVFGTASPSDVDLHALGAQGFEIDGVAAGDQAGQVAAAGDVNGDGLADVVIGAAGVNGNSGAAYAIFGKTSTSAVDLGALGTQGFEADGPGASSQFGDAVAGAGDINGDGRPDVVVGALGASNTNGDAGSAYVIFGKASTSAIDLSAVGSQLIRIDGAVAADQAGASVDGGGDVNGDGRPDVILGAPNVSYNGRTFSGGAYEVYGFGPASLSYPAVISGTVGQPVAALTPTLARTGPASFSVAPPLPAGLVLDPSTGTVTGTPTQPESTTAHTVTMSDLSGSATAPLQVTVDASPVTSTPPPPGGGTAPDVTPPAVSAFSITPRKFAVGPAPTPVSAHAVRGATFTYGLSEASTATITISRVVSGRRVGRTCRRATRKLRHAKRCTQLVKVGTLTRKHQPAGGSRVRFSGRIGRRALKPAAYSAAISAIDQAGNVSAKPELTSFEIVRR